MISRIAASEPRAPAKNQGPATAADLRVSRPSREDSGPGGRVRNERCTPFPHAARTAGGWHLGAALAGKHDGCPCQQPAMANGRPLSRLAGGGDCDYAIAALRFRL